MDDDRFFRDTMGSFATGSLIFKRFLLYSSFFITYTKAVKPFGVHE